MRNRIFAVALGALLAAVVYMSARPADSFKFNTSADALYLAPEAQDEFESKAAASEALRTPGTTDYTGPVLETYTFDLQPGSYTFTLYASADAGSGVFELYSPRYANDDNTPNRVLVSAPIEQGYEATALTLKTAEVVRGARLRIVRTDVKGSIEPYSISGDGGAAYSDALTLAVLTALFTIWAVSYYHRRREELRRGEFGASAAALCCILTAVISTAPIARYALVNGHDLVFHLTRIEGVYEGLLSGQFPVRLNPTFLNGYGYADAIMYPTLFLYFPAALRLLHVSLTVAYQLFIFAINLATAGLAYTCAKRLLRRRDLAIFLSAAYTLCLYRLICIFTRAAVGELIAMAFLPAVLLGMYEVFFGDEKRGRRWLILGFTGVVNSHVLSVEMAAVICLLFALANVRRLAELRRLAALLTSAIAVAALGAWVLVPMAHIGSTDLNVMHSFPNAAADAVYPAEMFATFVDALGLSGDLYAPYTGMPLSVGGILGIGALLFLFGRYLLRRDEDGEAARLGSLGLGGLKLAAVALFLASTLFPWTYISKIPGLGRLLVSVQFPWRWFCIASVALVLTLTAAVSYIARGSQNRRRAILVACALVVMASASPYIDGYMQNSGQTAALANKLAPLYSGHLGGQEYLRQGTAKSALESRPPVVEPSGEARVTRFSRDFTNAEFTYENAAPGDYAELPLYYYPGYAARDADGGALTVGAGENGVVRVDLPSGGGSVSVSYREPLSYRVSEIISLLALIILTALYLRSKIKVNKFLREE